MTKCHNCGYSGGFQSGVLENEWLAACPAVSDRTPQACTLSDKASSVDLPSAKTT